MCSIGSTAQSQACEQHRQGFRLRLLHWQHCGVNRANRELLRKSTWLSVVQRLVTYVASTSLNLLCAKKRSA